MNIMQYKSEYGWLYQVVERGDGYKAHYKMNSKDSWHPCRALPVQTSREDAESDLKDYAVRRRLTCISATKKRRP